MNILQKLKHILTPAKSNAAEVKSFYDSHTDKFLKVYGEVIQAFRSNNVSDYLDYTIQNAELKDGQVILDAGCGVGGPAAYFACRLNVVVEGITVSDVQVEKSKEIMRGKNLKGSVRIRQGDYHQIASIYGKEKFDRVIFLESFGHSGNKALLIEQSFEVLKPGGLLYIKDLFRREHPNPDDGKKIDRIIGEINKAYCYQVADLYEVLKTIRRLNFIILFIKTPEVKADEFEHLTISNNFQELFDIARILTWDDYVFPVDFYEIKAMKPPYDLTKDKHLYFLNRPEISSGPS